MIQTLRNSNTSNTPNMTDQTSRTTTDEFQTTQDTFFTLEEAQHPPRPPHPTNPRYSYFRQIHFTAGDQDQFEQYRNRVTGSPVIPERSSLSDWGTWRPLPDSIDSDVYGPLQSRDVTHTFQYIFHKFKKGLFVQIHQGTVRVMLPFSKQGYRNEWSDRIHVDPRYSSYMDLFQRVSELDGYPFNSRRVEMDSSRWYANNGLIRYESPIRENDSGVAVINHCLRTLCSEREIPDMEFFVNRRDFPILTHNRTEPYTAMFGLNHPLVSHAYNRYAPILSMCVTNNSADVPIPTWDDWGRVMAQEHIFFPKLHQHTFEFPYTWNEKCPTAVFRGSSTGLGVTIETNPRLRIAAMSQEQKRSSNGELYLDAGITKWNHRPRTRLHDHVLRTIEECPVPLVPRLSLQEQSQYKYIVHIEGHVAAYRLSNELFSGSCLLMVESSYQLWYSHLLEPYVHYIPIAHDLSDLYTQLDWCHAHDSECQAIAERAQQFAKCVLSKDSILDYLQAVLIRLKQRTGQVVYRFPYQKGQVPFFYSSKETGQPGQLRQLEACQNSDSSICLWNGTWGGTPRLPPYRRTYELMNGLQHVMIQSPIPQSWKRDSSTEYIRTKRTVLYKHTWGSIPILEKVASDAQQGAHETWIGLKAINRLFQEIPNVAYTFGSTISHNSSSSSSRSIWLEFVQHEETFFTYLSSSHFNIYEYVWILIQLNAVLAHAQQRCGFVHWDLYPWNILLVRTSTPIEVDYDMGLSGYIRIQTTVYPVLIDYGQSHAIIHGKRMGRMVPLQDVRGQDTLTSLISSMHQILHSRTVSSVELRILFQLSEWFNGSTYTNGQQIRSVKPLRRFLAEAKKFAHMLESDKGSVGTQHPWQFIQTMNSLLSDSKEFEGFKRGMYHTSHIRSPRVGMIHPIETPGDPIMRQGCIRHVVEWCMRSTCTPTLDALTRLRSLKPVGNRSITLWINLRARFIASTLPLTTPEQFELRDQVLKELETWIPSETLESMSPFPMDLPSLPTLTLDDLDSSHLCEEAFQSLQETVSLQHIQQVLFHPRVRYIDRVPYWDWWARFHTLKYALSNES
jgi:hypothetical protein